MNRYPRTPAMMILVAAASIGVLYVVAWGRVEKIWKKQGPDQGIEALEKQIAADGKTGRVPATTWRAYANALMDAKQFSKAAAAYREVLALEPTQRDAKFQCGMALAQAGAADDFYNFQPQMEFGYLGTSGFSLDIPETALPYADSIAPDGRYQMLLTLKEWGLTGFDISRPGPTTYPALVVPGFPTYSTVVFRQMARKSPAADAGNLYRKLYYEAGGDPGKQVGRRREGPELPAHPGEHARLEDELAGADLAGAQVLLNLPHLVRAQLPIQVVVQPAERLLAGQPVQWLAHRAPPAGAAPRRSSAGREVT